jgi:hypothetical protein
VVIMVVVVGGIIAAIVPPIVGASLGNIDLDAVNPEDVLRTIFFEHSLLIAWIIVVITLLLIVAMAVHSFVQAGSMGIYLDGERLARGVWTRPSFRAFAPDRWFSYGKRFWWQVFLIYNIIWGLFGLIVLIPLAVLTAAIYAARESEAVVPIACGGLFVVFALLFAGGFVGTVWGDLAIAESVRAGVGAGESCRRGGRALRRHFADVVAIVAVAIAASLAGVFVFLGLYFLIGLASSVPGLSLLFLPIQIVASFGQTAFNVMLSSWFIAAFAGVVLKEEAPARAA